VDYFKFDQHKNLIQHFKYEPSDPFILFDNVVACIIQTQEDTILVGTGSGVRIFNKVTQQFSRFHDDGNLNDSFTIVCSKIFQDKQGFIWFGRWGLGLSRYNLKTIHSTFSSRCEDSSSHRYRSCQLVFWKDRSGSLWVSGTWRT
jgi:ligand-binding sensor domain-containing protein